MDAPRGILKAKFKAASVHAKRQRQTWFCFFWLLTLMVKSCSFALHPTSWRIRNFCDWSFTHLNKKVSAHSIQACAAGVFWLKFFRIGNESPGLMGSRWAQKCISPFYPQTLLRFLRVLNIHGPTLHKASVDLMVCISPKHTQTSCKLFPAYLGPSLPSNRRLPDNALSFANDQSFYLHLYRTEGDLSLCPTPFLENPTAPCRKPSPCNCFCRGTRQTCWSTARWMLRLWKLRNTHTTNQANKPRHPQERLSFKNREFLSSNPRPSYVLSFPTAGGDALRPTGGAAIWVNLNLSVTLN